MPVENTTVPRLVREGYRVRVAVRHPGQEPDVLARLLAGRAWTPAAGWASSTPS